MNDLLYTIVTIYIIYMLPVLHDFYLPSVMHLTLLYVVQISLRMILAAFQLQIALASPVM